MALAAIIILAAGRSKRMRTQKSKVLHALMGKPMIFYSIELAEKLKAQKTIIVINPFGEDIKQALAQKKVEFAVQKEPLGTAHAVASALPRLKGLSGSVLIFYADNPLFSLQTLKALVQAHEDAKAALSLLTAVFPRPVPFGRIIRGARGEVLKIVEEPDCTPEQLKIREVNAGVYCVDLEFLKSALAEIKPENAQHEYYLTDIVSLASDKNLAITTGTALDWRETIGINSRAELARAVSILRDKINTAWMKNGVTIEIPARVYIEPEVIIGEDTVIEPDVRLSGKTKIGKNCWVQACARIIDSMIEDGVEIRQGSVLEGSQVKAGSSIGPMAHLRPGSIVGNNARIGNFVELKNAVVGDNTIAAHLTYLGDAKIGKRVNIGAGVITCNFDGAKKSQTIIEDEAFIGSDSQLIAPVKIGRKAYIGSGSTITEDVPAGALAVARAEQVIKPKWSLSKAAAGAVKKPAKKKLAAKKPKAKPKARPIKRAEPRKAARSVKRPAPKPKKRPPAKPKARSIKRLESRAAARSVKRSAAKPKKTPTAKRKSQRPPKQKSKSAARRLATRAKAAQKKKKK